MKVSTAPIAGTGRSVWVVSWLLALAMTGLLVLGGCGAGNPYPPGSYDRAMFFVEQEKNLEAVAALETFVRHNPTDSLASEAQYQKSMIYMDMDEYPLAAVEFQILRKDYPTSDRAEDSFFQEGVSYYRQVGNVRRDLTGAHEARLHFLKFSQEYPASLHMPQVVEYMQEISDLMVCKRLEQAKVFWQLKRFEAVKVTLGTALEDEAASNLLDEVLWQRGQAAEKLDDPDLASEMYERIISEFPDSDFFKQAQSAIKDLDEEKGEDEEQ